MDVLTTTAPRSERGWNRQVLDMLSTELQAIHADLLGLEKEFGPGLTDYGIHQRSARNLIHYLALRRHDIRQLQEQLAALGLSSLGRMESHVLFGIEAVLKVLATSAQTVYLSAGNGLAITHIPKGTGAEKVRAQAIVAPPSPDKAFILLKPGDRLVVTRAFTPGRPAIYDEQGQVAHPATIACTLPEVFADVRPNEPVWFDDGKIGGLIESVCPDEMTVRITVAKPGGDKLGADKGINLPKSTLHLPALTEKDMADLAFVVKHADMVGLSFVRQAKDVMSLQAELARFNAQQMGIVLKIETRGAFEQLPAILLEAMRGHRVGVMIARGDLAVECGWERLAEVQEEILWVCEAAHIPVIWATQVLESLAKKGAPSRAEITDAAMGERAECVMLNKGPHLVEAVRVLDGILCRMEAHQSKKSARLRRLHLSDMSNSQFLRS